MEIVDGLIPILVCRCSKPTTFNYDFLEESDLFEGTSFLKDNSPFNYAVSLCRGKSGKHDIYVVKMILNHIETEKPIVDMRIFTKKQSREMATFMSLPSRIFKPTEIDVLLFPGSRMTAKEIAEAFLKWKTQT
jgi:hypothetical protein